MWTRNRNLLVQNVIHVCCLWWPLNSHRRQCHEREFKCERCNFTLRSIEEMESHKLSDAHNFIIWKSLQDGTLYLTDGPFESYLVEILLNFSSWNICMRTLEQEQEICDKDIRNLKHEKWNMKHERWNIKDETCNKKGEVENRRQSLLDEFWEPIEQVYLYLGPPWLLPPQDCILA